MTAQESLLPCPFCGGESEQSYNDFYRDMSMVQCKRCGASAYKTKWNRRQQVARTPLTDGDKRRLVIEWSYSSESTGSDFLDGVNYAEKAHGITQEQQGC